MILKKGVILTNEKLKMEIIQTIVQSTAKDKKLEVVLDICATASILIKFGSCHILENQSLFIAFLNESGFRTVSGKEFTKMSFRQMFDRLTYKERLFVIGEFKKGHRDTEMFSTMFA
jgi:hypothetical protein